MNRQLTGWLAWGALAVVISVPSADLALRSGNSAPEMAVLSEADSNSNPYFVGPNQPKTERKDLFAIATSEQAVAPSAPEPVRDTPDVSTDAVRVVARATTAREYTPADIGGLEQASPPVVVIYSNGRDAPPVNVAATDNSAQPDPQPEQVTEETETVAIAAPTPMPAHLRPAPKTVRPETLIAPTQSEPTRQTVAATPAPTSGSFVTLSGREDNASDSGFFQVWQSQQPRPPVGFRSRGSFEEQLPLRRGNGVRMDVLQ